MENKLYPLRRGDVIVARPGEYHHCVYHSDALHALYWILFDTSGNDALLASLFAHIGRHGNLISPVEKDRERLIVLCERLLLSPPSAIAGYADFFELLSLIANADQPAEHTEMAIPHELIAILEYIDAHLADELTLEVLAKIAYTSPSTLERRFSKFFGMRTAQFIRRRRLSTAALLLERGYSVLQAGEAVGYTDNSHFIKRFCEYTGMTPLRYKKKHADKK